ncbi:MAG: ATP-binding protein [Lachnospiraceae bacterium]|nr:ATP-binding protein [Lachnospiraceae bacterium]
MPLTNKQYDEIMREYDEIRLANHKTEEKRLEEVQNRIPGYKEVRDSLLSLRMEKLRSSLSNGSEMPDYEAKKDALIEKRDRLLAENGYPADYLAPIYSCPDCKDTGYLPMTRTKCKCFKSRIAKVLLETSGMAHLLEKENFSTLSTEYFNEEEAEQFRIVLDFVKDFTDNFDSDYQNILFYGNVGTGKTFLSSCIAGELIKRGLSVLYFSANELFSNINAARFAYDADGFSDYLDDLIRADLLIIDDLGTEKTTDRIQADLFQLLNGRDQISKSTLISTNLKFAELTERYSERVASRIGGGFKVFRFEGRDIRILKKLNK